jgi:hypothetical protein
MRDTTLGGYARKQVLFGKIDEAYGLFTRDGGEGFQEIVQGRVALDMIDKGLDRNPGSPETGLAAHAVRIDPDDFIKPGLLLHGHDFTLLETVRSCKEKGLPKKATLDGSGFASGEELSDEGKGCRS